MYEEDSRKGEPSGVEADGMAALVGEKETFYCLSVIGQIEGHFVLDSTQKATKYDHIIPLLAALEESERIDGILILINTLGGDVEAGLAIAEVIASLSKPTVSIVLGGGHSIGVPLAVSAKKSLIVPSATMTIHPVRTQGVTLGVPQAFDYLEKMQDRIIRFITDHSKIREDEYRRLLSRTDVLASDIGSILNGNEAVASGLIDGIGGIKEGLEALRKMAKKTKNGKK